MRGVLTQGQKQLAFRLWAGTVAGGVRPTGRLCGAVGRTHGARREVPDRAAYRVGARWTIMGREQILIRLGRGEPLTATAVAGAGCLGGPPRDRPQRWLGWIPYVVRPPAGP